LEKVRVIPYGVDLAEYRPCPDQRRKVRAELDLPQDVRIVGMVARLAAAKRVEYGISLLEGLVEHAAEAHLAIVGDGALHSKLAAQAERLGLSNRVHFLGVRHDVPRVMQAFDVYLQATMGSTVGSTTLEALASGVPVVFAVHDGDEAAIPRITLKEGETGFVVTMDNPAVAAARVAALLADPARLAHMRLQARALAEERFDLSASVRAVEAIYEELASRRPPRR
ncbi:MAG: glycosyltransferase, partial [Chloroflexi bacterium]|nr:glycosyltransferase [Chloroflexota bacterium]